VPISYMIEPERVYQYYELHGMVAAMMDIYSTTKSTAMIWLHMSLPIIIQG